MNENNKIIVNYIVYLKQRLRNIQLVNIKRKQFKQLSYCSPHLYTGALCIIKQVLNLFSTLVLMP